MTRDQHWHFHLNFPGHPKSCSGELTLSDLEKAIRPLLMKQTELKEQLDALVVQADKIATEQRTRFDTLSAEIKRLEEVIANGDVNPDLEASFTKVKTAWQALDDTIPDQPTEPPAPPA